MADPTLTHLYFLLDRSGSMTSIRTATIEGFDAYMAEQRKAPGTCKVTLAQFDHEYVEVYAERDATGVPPLDLEPRGSTALLDAIGRLVTTAKQRIGSLREDERPASVIVGIMTDGHENASQEWQWPAINELISTQVKDEHWEFLYLGADQDAIAVAAQMGIAADKAVTYGRGKAREAMTRVGEKNRAYRQAVAMGAAPETASVLNGFDADDRADLA